MTKPYTIGVFDSGLGGLSVLDALASPAANIPAKGFVYLGDTRNMPYGEKSPEQLAQLLYTNLDWLARQQQVDCVVLGCNTTAAILLSGQFDAQQYFPGLPILDPIRPTAQWVAGQTSFTKIGVLATQATVNSGQYVQQLQALNPALEVKQVACNGLVQHIEAGTITMDHCSDDCQVLLHRYTEPLVSWGAEAVILGCTHYPFIAPILQTFLGASAPDSSARGSSSLNSSSLNSSVMLINPAEFLAQAVRDALLPNAVFPNVLVQQPEPVSCTYFVTGNPETFYQVGQKLPLQHLQLSIPVQLDSPALMNPYHGVGG